MSKTSKFSPEVRQRAVRRVVEHPADYGAEPEAKGAIFGSGGFMLPRNFKRTEWTSKEIRNSS